MTRLERHAEVNEARERGEHYKITCKRLGISRSYYYDLVSDPTGEAVKRRKLSYGGWCQNCGATTNGSAGPGKAATLCATCEQAQRHEFRYWNRERVVEAIKLFNTLNGRPPRAGDFSPALLARCSPERIEAAEKARNGAHYPPLSIVMREFGSWSEAVRAAGLEPGRAGRPRIGSKSP